MPKLLIAAQITKVGHTTMYCWSHDCSDWPNLCTPQGQRSLQAARVGWLPWPGVQQTPPLFLSGSHRTQLPFYSVLSVCLCVCVCVCVWVCVRKEEKSLLTVHNIIQLVCPSICVLSDFPTTYIQLRHWKNRISSLVPRLFGGGVCYCTSSWPLPSYVNVKIQIHVLLFKS